MSSRETIVVHGVPVFGNGVEPTIGAPQDATGNDLVRVTSWIAEYKGGQLQVDVSVQPVNAADTITSLTVAATLPNNPDRLVAGSNTVVYDAPSAGASVAGMAFSGLWTPSTYGDQVLASINGLVYSNGRAQSYGWEKTMKVLNT